MNIQKFVAVALAALLVSAGAAAAVPSMTPDEAQSDDHSQADDNAKVDENAQADDARADADENASETPDLPPQADNGQDASAAQGPPVDLPSQVPDFVSTLHKKIASMDSGLGDVLPDITPGGSAE